MLQVPQQTVFEKYSFNPYQFAVPEEIGRDFHSQHATYFSGCSKVLDLGAGRGLFLRELKDNGIEGLGVENDSESIAVGEKFDVQFIKADIFHFLRAEENKAVLAQCDGIYCAFVLEHLDPEQVFELFHLVRTKCAPNVRCRFITNNPEDLDVLGYTLWVDLTHRRLYPCDLLVGMAKSQGFTKVTASVFSGLTLNWIGRFKVLICKIRWGRKRGRPNLLLDCS